MALFRRKKMPEPEPEPTILEVAVPALDGIPEVSDAGLRSMQDHRDFLLSKVEPLPPFGMALLDAWGLALCEDIQSPTHLPTFDNSQMDGYAVLAADVALASPEEPVELKVVGVVNAGDASELTVEEGTAARIMTGAAIPPGADAVVPFEDTDRGDDVVQVSRSVQVGQFVRAVGSDVVDGAPLMARGQRLDARSIGLLAAVGIDKVLARPRPRVVVVSTGAELVDPGRPLTQRGQIHDANSFLIAAAAKAEGAQMWRVTLPSDDPNAVREVISDQLIRADLIISTGGISEGDRDVVKQVMPRMGGTDFSQVAMQPGKPQGFGLIGEDEVPMIMVPGNPVSAYVSFQAFVRPVLRKLMGLEPQNHVPVRCIASSTMRSVRGKLQFGRGEVVSSNGQRMVSLVGGHSSHLLGDLAKSNALVLLGEDVETVEAGQPVMCWILDHD